jgi:DUF2993 family protein
MLRLLRRLLIPIVVLAVLFFGANTYVEHVAEDRVASAVRDEFHLAAKPSVDISGFPIIFKIFSGTIPGVAFRAARATFQGLAVDDIVVDLRGITADGGLLGGGKLAVRVSSGSVSARATDASVGAYLRAHGEQVTIAFHEKRATTSTVRRVFGANRRIVASGPVTKKGDRLVFTPQRVTVDGKRATGSLGRIARATATFSVTLPALPGGIRSYEIATHEGFLELVATIRGQKVVIRG